MRKYIVKHDGWTCVPAREARNISDLLLDLADEIPEGAESLEIQEVDDAPDTIYHIIAGGFGIVSMLIFIILLVKDDG